MSRRTDAAMELLGALWFLWFPFVLGAIVVFCVALMYWVVVPVWMFAAKLTLEVVAWITGQS